MFILNYPAVRDRDSRRGWEVRRGRETHTKRYEGEVWEEKREGNSRSRGREKGRYERNYFGVLSAKPQI